MNASTRPAHPTHPAWPEELPCTLAFADGMTVDVEATSQPSELRFFGSPGYALPLDPEDEGFEPAAMRFTAGSEGRAHECELSVAESGLVTLSMVARFEHRDDAHFAAALHAFHEVCEIWALILDDEAAQPS